MSGLFLVIEGSDGSGKATQCQLLAEQLIAKGLPVKQIDFPRYQDQASHFVRRYLKGDYGSASQLGPYIPSLFYALDRYDAGLQIKQWLAEGCVVLADRYISANKAHQGQKLDSSEQRRDYYQWLDKLEFDMLQIPRPDTTLVLSLPAEISLKLIAQRAAKTGSDESDIHQADPEHLQRAVATYQELCRLYPDEYQLVDCAQSGQLRSIESINKLINRHIAALVTDQLAATPPVKTQLTPANANPYIAKNTNGSYQITAAGSQFLRTAVTNTDKDVYAFTEQLKPATIAAAMARLSRRGDDMRVTLLDEFSAEGKDEALLRRVITAYGDDSVQQLTGIHVVVENASNLLTKKLEWGRLAAYLEQSTRYIYFDQKDAKGHYKFHTPSTLRGAVRKRYISDMNKLFDGYSELVKKLTDFVRGNSKLAKGQQDGAWKAATRAQACDAARLVLPVATTSTVGIFASGQALESLIMHLLSDEFAEARSSGQALLTEARKVVPTFLERADKADRGGAWVAHRAMTRQKINQLAADKSLQPIKGDAQDVHLAEFWPKNEFDVLPHVVYPHSSLSLQQLASAISAWSYDDKAAALKSYFGERLNRRHKPGRALEIPHYTFDIVCDYGIFRDLQRHRMVDALEWQDLSPHYGYEIPELVSQAGLEDLFEACFDLSVSLYAFLQSKDSYHEAQYATLLGHKMRWKLTLNARAAFHFMELRTSPQGHPGYRAITKQMHQLLAEVHPIIASGMIFVDQGEDPELTRLAAEKATQFKLNQLH